MIKPTVKRGLMLDFIPDERSCATEVEPNRVFKLNDKDIIDGEIIYIMSRELRVEDNWAFIFASDIAQKYNKSLKIIILLDPEFYSKRQHPFLTEGVGFLKGNLTQNNIDYSVVKKMPENRDLNAGGIIVDFNPINIQSEFAQTQNCAVYEVDSHNIIPARIVSNKQEFSAATLRRKIYANIAGFLTEFPNKQEIANNNASNELENFIQNKLDFYAEQKNDPNKDYTSNLSPYLHFGFISSQRITLEVLKYGASRENKEAFLEELIVRKELSDNFCLHNKKYKSFDGILNWAKTTLDAHKSDLRTYIYSQQEFEYAKTHDELWNKIQLNLLETGKIHGYLRMYWAKKILEWSKSPEEALKIAIYLNDTYAIDGTDPNGYVGILWCIGGLHDRAFANRLVTGKIRYMSLDGCKKKFDVLKYTGKETWK